MATKSLLHRILDFVHARESVTTDQVVAVVGRFIPEAQAVKNGRAYINRPYYRNRFDRNHSRYTTEYLARIGRKEMVSMTLRRAVSRGKIRRISRGVYGPLLPQIYPPSVAG